jgi:release factor glutamine methyltransferase
VKPKAILKTRRLLPSIHDALVWADLPALESEILLSAVLNLDRTNLFTHSENKLNHSGWEKFQRHVMRRKQNEPIAYILGYKEFYGLKLKVDKRALIPRPETEELVLEALKLNPQSVADIGTGCGAIAIALAKHLPKAKIYASDVSAEALQLARENAKLQGIYDRITFLNGSLAEPLPEPVELMTANLPYVRRWMIDKLPEEIKDYEPRIALDGGDDGLYWYKKLFSQASEKLLPEGEILYELDGRIFVWTPQVKRKEPR